MRYHGVDLHKRYATISVRDDRGQEVGYLPREVDFRGYVQRLGQEDVVVLEASAGTLWWAEGIANTGARCIVIDPHRYRIIRDSWNKTDRRDAAALSLGLWLAEHTREVKLPVVWQPGPAVRELRRLFSHYQLLTNQIRQLKNEVHGMLTDNGMFDGRRAKAVVEAPQKAEQLLQGIELSEASRLCVRMSLEQLQALNGQKLLLRRQIYGFGRPLEAQVRLLIGIRGITPLLALAFLAEVGDIRRFRSARRLFSYLGVVPRIHSSGGITRSGPINRASRGLARSLFTQAVPHLADSSRSLGRFYADLVERRGYGRARIALLRKVFAIMRRMLMDCTPYAGMELTLYSKKVQEWERELKKLEVTPNAA